VGINSSLVTSNASLTVLKLLNMRIAVQNVVTAGVLIAVLTACDEPKITSYRVAKEQTANTTGDPPAGHAHEDTPPPRSRPKITWTLPSGWRETAPGQVNLAAFNIQSAEGKDAQVTVAALPFLAGRETDIVNLWRGQLGLSELTPDQAREQLRDLQVNDEKAKLFELSSGDAAKPDKIVTVMIHRPGASWFYKLSGDSVTVEAQRTAFIDFIKSVKLDEVATPTAAPTNVEAGSSGFAKVAPKDWQVLPAGQMQLAKFAVPEVQGAKAQVSVSMFDNDTGGTLANVNRWRGQIGLGEITAAQLSEVTSPLDAKLPRAVLVNLTNNDQQIIGAIVPRGGQWFFYKLMGSAPAVVAQKEAFVRFASTEL
jgi:hypothetical protein